MNTDDLISQYIDGDLNENEDALLRMQMSDNQQVKDDFDDALFVHCAMKDDADAISLPEGLLEQTRNAVDEAAKREQTVIVKLYKRNHEIRRFVSAVAAVLVLGFAFVSDFPLLRYYTELTRYQAIEAESNLKHNTNTLYYNKVVKNDDISAKMPKKHRTSITKTDNSALLAMIVGDTLDENTAEQFTESKSDENAFDFADSESFAFVSDNSGESATQKISVSDRLSFYESQLSEKATKYHNRQNLQVGSFKTLENSDLYKSKYEINPDIELATTYGGMNVNNVFDNAGDKLTIGLSQSLGYRFATRHKIGFEFGYMGYSYKQKSFTQISGGEVNTNSASVEIPKDGLGSGKPTIIVPVENSVNDRSLWATVFYEYRLFDNGRFNIDAHFGLGGNSYGVMNVDRLSGNLWLVDGVKFTVGLDGRFFTTDIASGGKSTRKLRSAIGLVYGIQFDF